MLLRLEDVSSIVLIILEQFVSFVTFLLPERLILFFTRVVKFIFSRFKTNDINYNRFLVKDKLQDDKLLQRIEDLRSAASFKELCELNNFKVQNHLIQTTDGYLLTAHRLNPELNGFKPNGQIAYFQHGLLMSSEIWVLMNDKDLNLPFRLCEMGYDVFLGNNRGNKYSNKHVSLSTSDPKFWDFSIDEFAMYDIPCTIDYILSYTNSKSLTYIGFSQGCSQILASVSINKDLNSKISKLILIAPATTPKRLCNWLINSIVNFKPSLLFLLFGKKILMKSTLFWQRIMYPPFFIKMIDLPNKILFDWRSENITNIQKIICYFHLYSTTSVKSVVHWFQIIRSKKFQMYHDSNIFNAFEYPTSTSIAIPDILLIYGMSDSLVDITQMLDHVPLKSSKMTVIGVEKYEHLDLIWGKNTEYYVLDNVFKFLNESET
ncbi:hypothetical protein CANARDRAFT_199050 [[Candida] arabinofermentans NRRL YB-2248]|uniref:Lipase n=1 Tax=[Candida] arabinofermentans NRRL YB-2248 TaxID=983967 RepID=A0A1E4T075_9ASCO|nr:hypothetical protein CANARDRAFT_199050 [[Candida] arabinofermentans NRRL YB-2248]